MQDTFDEDLLGGRLRRTSIRKRCASAVDFAKPA